MSSARSIAFLTACLTAFLVALLGLLIFAVNDQTRILQQVLPAAGIALLVTYVVVYFLLQRFIYGRLKGIYNTIHRLKASVRNNGVRPGSRLISNLEHEVFMWSEEKGSELASMREMEQFRREFVGNVAHELKTPIFNIQGYLDTLIEGRLEDERINLQYLRKASANVDRLMAIVNDLTMINTLESGKHAIDISGFDIRQLAIEVFESLEMQAASSDVKLRLKDGSDKALIVKGDRNMIRQALVNLVNNSIKYSKDAGGATVVRFNGNRDSLLVEVSDNGIGISAEDLPRVFERFYRVDTSRSRDRGGTGLGLSIVKHIIEAHGQTVNVKSSPGQGSAFSFTLPRG